MPGNVVIRGHSRPGLECGSLPPGDARETGPSVLLHREKRVSETGNIAPGNFGPGFSGDGQVCPGLPRVAVYPLIREQVMYYISVKPFFLSDPDIFQSVQYLSKIQTRRDDASLPWF